MTIMDRLLANTTAAMRFQGGRKWRISPFRGEIHLSQRPLSARIWWHTA